jgi:hypothetical protein
LITDDYIRTALDRIDEYLLDKKRTLLKRKLDVMYMILSSRLETS